MNVKTLIDSWKMPDRTSERTQITLRISVQDYARLHALKAVYPTRSVNDFICDIVRTGLDEIVDALPSHTVDERDISLVEEPPEHLGHTFGPRVTFDAHLDELLTQKLEENAA